jgi:AcrR family transcriptional regulator
VRRSKFGRKTRAEKSEEARNALFHAAAEIVGEHGYGSASISRITQRAKLAQGTFYNYFASRQAIFDELLPALGEEMLAHIRARVIEGSTFLDREERAFRAFFEFLAQVPHFLRILNEAEIAAPRAFRQHFRNVSAGYARVLRRARDRGEIRDLSDDEIETVVYVLMSARSYLALRHAAYGRGCTVPEPVVSAYMKLVSRGLAPAAAASRKPRRAPDAAKSG